MSYHGNLSGTLGMSGAAKWYYGQHTKVQDAIKKGDLKAAIEFATALGDLGIANKKYDEVINSPELLQKFKEGCLSQYGDQGSKKNKEVADKVITLVDSAIAAATALTAPLPTLGPTETTSFMMNASTQSAPATTSGTTMLFVVGAAALALLAVVALLRKSKKKSSSTPSTQATNSQLEQLAQLLATTKKRRRK